MIPGLIDQHTHGAANFDAIDGKLKGIHEIACALAQEGGTAFLPTTTTQSIEVINKSLKSVYEIRFKLSNFYLSFYVLLMSIV